MDSVNFLGVKFDDIEAQEVVGNLLKRRAEARFAYIVTPNADHLARLKRLPELRKLYDSAWLRLLDSQFLRRAAGALGLYAPHVATGADVTALLLTLLPPQKITVIGLDEKYFSAVAARYPHLTFVHHLPPAHLLYDHQAIAQARDFAVREAAAFTLIALGSPIQEMLAYAIWLQPGSTGCGLCIGAALEFLSGAKRRAPVWMQRAGMEWIFRLAQDPRRLARRYLLDDPPVLWDLVRARFRKTARLSRPGQPLPVVPGASVANDPYPPRPSARLHEIQDAG
jgi:exopolysaccharide biosynthesis WecB/TagA/CpsF family protein